MLYFYFYYISLFYLLFCKGKYQAFCNNSYYNIYWLFNFPICLIIFIISFTIQLFGINYEFHRSL